MFLTACTQPKYALARFEITKEKQKTVGKLLNYTVVQYCCCNSKDEVKRGENRMLLSYVFIQAH